MNKKIVFFEDRGDKWDETTINGGSETWIDRTSRILSQMNHDITIYSNPLSEHTTKEGVKYRYLEKYDKEEYDIALLVRYCKDFFKINSKNIYCVAHDIILFDFTQEMYESEQFKGIFVLSEWQKEFIKKKYPFIKDDKLFPFANGFDQELYGNLTNDSAVRENAMVWSSRPERGLGFFTKKVFPLIRKYVPDFKVYLCSYCGIPDEYYNKDGYVILGYLNKEALRDYQRRCKIWIYPNMGYIEQNYDNFFFETYCITAIENAMAGNAIITNDGGGLSSTLKGYSGLLKFDEMSKMSEDEYAKVLADRAIDLLTCKQKREALIKELYHITCDKTWEKATDNFLNIILRT